jgi:2-iminobutanoate/2-iminopropanoate deaminase
MMKIPVSTTAAPAAIGPYSQAIKANNMLFISGQIPMDPVNNIVPETIEEQTKQSLQNGVAILEAEGLTTANVVKTTVFITDLNNFAAMNAVYTEFFSEPFPARSTIEVSKLPRDAMVEIEMTAVFD